MSDSCAPNFEDLQEAIHKSLTAWGDIGSNEEELLGYLLLVQEERNLIEGGSDPLSLRSVTNRVLENALHELASQEQIEAEVLRSRFIKGQIIRQVATRIHASTDQVNRYQRSAIANLARIILAREINSRELRLRELESELPPSTYSLLFGFDEAVEAISTRLCQQEPPWILSITGLGGIGKTSLADAAVRHALRSFKFSNIIWSQVASNVLSGAPLSPEESYSQLLNTLASTMWPDEPFESDLAIEAVVRDKFTKECHIIVIDSVETEEIAEYLADKARNWIQPSKVLFTTRSRPSSQAEVYYYTVGELSLKHATELLKHQANLIGLEEFATAPESEFAMIYGVIGGNPLALKLVVSLASTLALPQVLEDLGQSHLGPVEELYRNIYWESWRSLSKDAQSLLLAMPLVAESGALPEQMLAISQLHEKRFWPAVSELISRSLLEVKGTVHERRYGIHRLTETFLRAEIIGELDH